RNRTVLLPKSPKLPLLITESADDFEVLHDSVARRLQPHDIIEWNYVQDISYTSWEIERLRRSKTATINAAFRDALEQVLVQMLRQPGQDADDVEADAKELAFAWFTDQKVKKEVSELLRRFGLDESAIEAEAIRSSSSEIESLERMLASLEFRRDKALACIGEYRVIVVPQLRETADLGKLLPPGASGKHSTAACAASGRQG